MKGRPRKPAQLKIIQGTFQPSRNPVSEPEFLPLTEIPEPPKAMNKYGKELWEKLGRELIVTGVMTTPDLIAFEMLCSTFGRYKIYEDYIAKSPLTNIDGKHGGRSAQSQQMNADLSMCIKLMQQFGLTPSDRNRLGISPKKKVDPDTERMKELLL